MLLIDGHNLTFADDRAKRLLQGGDPEGSRLRVLDLVDVYARVVNKRALVVFDGAGGPFRQQPKTARVKYFFAGMNRSADDEIIERIDASTGQRELVVVSNDRQLAAAARRRGAGICRVEDMLKEVARALRKKAKDNAAEPAGKRFGAPPSEVEYWLKEFSDDGTGDESEEDGPAGKKRRK